MSYKALLYVESACCLMREQKWFTVTCVGMMVSNAARLLAQGYAGSSVENQGHMVPIPFVHHFLEGVQRGNPQLPSLGQC